MNINDLPGEILCHILKYVEAYEDMDSCNLVCQRWSALVTVVRNQRKNEAINNFKLGRIDKYFINAISDPVIIRVCKHNSDFYAMGHLNFRDVNCKVFKINLTSKTFEHITTTGDIHQAANTFQLISYRGDLVFFDILNYYHVALHTYNIKSRSWVKRRILVKDSIYFTGECLVHADNLIGYQFQQRKPHVYNFTTTTSWEPKVLNPPPRNLPLFPIYTKDDNSYFMGQNGTVWRLKFNVAKTDEAWNWTELVVENFHQQLDIFQFISCTVDECAFCLTNLRVDYVEFKTVALVVDFSRALKEDKVKVEIIQLSDFFLELRFMEFTGTEFIIVGSK